jgi:hypothetical protein
LEDFVHALRCARRRKRVTNESGSSLLRDAAAREENNAGDVVLFLERGGKKSTTTPTTTPKEKRENEKESTKKKKKNLPRATTTRAQTRKKSRRAHRTFGPRLLLIVLATLFAADMFAFCASIPLSRCLELCSCFVASERKRERELKNHRDEIRNEHKDANTSTRARERKQTTTKKTIRTDAP